ncbi:uncharacterized protein LOC134209173 [Armigeres subalbatus]|uniref:uncharacterized protein LOC134209173 n=1 Tax=Armigeres subalbatus TaxID=124917 RepID=UPI002ED0C259
MGQTTENIVSTKMPFVGINRYNPPSLAPALGPVCPSSPGQPGPSPPALASPAPAPLSPGPSPAPFQPWLSPPQSWLSSARLCPAQPRSSPPQPQPARPAVPAPGPQLPGLSPRPLPARLSLLKAPPQPPLCPCLSPLSPASACLSLSRLSLPQPACLSLLPACSAQPAQPPPSLLSQPGSASPACPAHQPAWGRTVEARPPYETLQRVRRHHTLSGGERSNLTTLKTAGASNRGSSNTVIRTLVQPYDGSAEGLDAFLDATNLLEEITANNMVPRAIKFLKTRLTGKARLGLPENLNTIDELAQNVKQRCANKITPDNVVAKLRAVKQKGSVENFCDEVDTLTNKLKAVYIEQGIPCN